MSACSCSHHHIHDTCGHPAPIAGQLALSDDITCSDMAQLMALLMHAETHVAATRAEPGCLYYEIAQTADPMVWRVEGLFHDAAALEFHRKRTAAGPWAVTAGLSRDQSAVAPI